MPHFAEWCRETVVLTADETGTRLECYSPSGDVQLAFLRHPLERLGRVFDAILAVVAIGRKQPDHLVGAAGGRPGHVAGSEIDSLSNGEFVFQRPLHHARTPATLTVPLAVGRLKNPG